MSSLVREVLLKFGVVDTGVAQAAARSESAIKRLESGAGGLARSFAQGAAASLGFAGGMAAVTLAMTRALREIADLEQSMLRLKLATGDNASEFDRLSVLIQSTPRGGLFDDNDVARAVSMAKFLDLSADEIERLLPVIKGMAAVLDQDLATALQNVAFAIETGQVRSLRQYGISLADVERAAQSAFKEPLKDLDELQRRQAVLNAVMEKASLFANAEAEAMKTLGGSFRVLKTEIGELIEDAMEPLAKILAENLARINAQRATFAQAVKPGSLPGAGAETELSARLAEQNDMARARAAQDVADAELAKNRAIAASIGTTLEAIAADKAAAEALEKRAKAIGLTVDQFKKLAEAQAARTFAATVRPGTAAEMLGPQPGVFGPLTATQQGLLLDTGQAPGQIAAAAPGAIPAATSLLSATGSPRLEVEHLTNEELVKAREDLNSRLIGLGTELSEQEIELHQTLTAQIKAIDDEQTQRIIDNIMRRRDRAAAAVAGFISVTDRAAEAAFRREEGRQKTISKVIAAAAQESVAAVLKTLQQEALVKAAIAAGDLQFGRAAKYAAAAALAGAAAARFSTLAEQNIGQAEAAARQIERPESAAAAREPGQRAFGLTFTRPVENVSITNAISINGQVQMFGTDQTRTMRDLFEQILPLIQEALTAGRLAA